MKNAPAIDQLFGFVEERLHRLENMPMDGQDLPIKYMVMYTFLDSLSAIVYPELSNNRDRFVKILSEHADWKYGHSVSWPHLARLLEITKDGRFKAAREKYGVISGNYRNGEFRDLELDPAIESVLDVWPVGASATIEKITSLNSLRHVELMYASRNRLVHEHRESGNGWDVSGKSTHPFYHELLTDYGQSIELVYPIGFVFKLAWAVVRNTRKYFESEDIDPYESFGGGSFYIDKLNLPPTSI